MAGTSPAMTPVWCCRTQHALKAQDLPRWIYRRMRDSPTRMWCLSPRRACADRVFLFRLNAGIAARASGRRNDRRLAGLRRRRLHAGVDLGRADHAVGLAKSLAQRLVAALLLGAGL